MLQAKSDSNVPPLMRKHSRASVLLPSDALPEKAAAHPKTSRQPAAGRRTHNVLRRARPKSLRMDAPIAKEDLGNGASVCGACEPGRDFLHDNGEMAAFYHAIIDPISP